MTAEATLRAFSRGTLRSRLNPRPAAPPLAELRRAADILRGARGPLRPIEVEVFRHQFEFNHALVDALELLPWLAKDGRSERVRAWLDPLVPFRLMVPSRRGAKARAVRVFKTAALTLGRPALVTLTRRLERENAALVTAVAKGERFVPSWWPPVGLLRNQAQFYGACARFLLHWEPLARTFARSAPEEDDVAQLTDVSLLIVGPVEHPISDPCALEALVETVPPGSHPSVRRGDVRDARGKWILRVPNDETIHSGAWRRALRSRALLVYGDVQVGSERSLRPGWSPDAILRHPLVGGCFAVDASTAKNFGLSRAHSATEWLLRPGFESESVERVPLVLSSRRAASSEAVDAGSVERELDRRRASHQPRRVGAPLVSIIVPFKDKPELLKALWSSLNEFDAGMSWELILVSNNSQERETAELVSTLKHPNVRIETWNRPFNYSAINNFGAGKATGRWLLFLNNDVQVRHEGWLRTLIEHLELPGVGVVGARLVYPDGSVQHAGVLLGLKGLAGHQYWRWRPEYGTTPSGDPSQTRNWLAVTGACLGVHRDQFERVGGFDERMQISGSDIELCLRIGRDGGRTVCVGAVELIHAESVSRGKDPVPLEDVRREVEAYLPWLLAGDPYGHPLLSSEAANGGPALRLESPTEHALRVIDDWLLDDP